MNEQLKLLISLQKIDTEINEKENLIRDIERDAEQISAEIDLNKNILKSKKDTLLSKEKELRSKERMLEDTNIHLQKCRGKVYKIASQKELAALDEEIEKAKKQKSTIESEILVLMEEIESLSSEVKTKESALSAEIKDATERKDELRKILEEARERINSLSGEREGFLKDIDSALLSEYQRLLKGRGVLAVVEMNNGICQGCHMSVPSKLINEVKKNDQIIRCEHCARILYWNEK